VFQMILIMHGVTGCRV